MECGDTQHSHRGSIYPRQCVPEHLFENLLSPNAKPFKCCLDCRMYARETMKKTKQNRLKRSKLENENETYTCARCGTMRTNNHCERCYVEIQKSALRKKNLNKKIMFERIVKIGCCCEKCKKVFLINHNGPRFITVESLDGVKMEDIEYRNLNWDHLDEKEQWIRFGEYYGEKEGEVGSFTSYDAKNDESKKCALLCIYCHKLETQRRYGDVSYRTKIAEKREIVRMEKIKIGQCDVCNIAIDLENLMYFEFDHIDPKNKIASISLIMSSSSLAYSVDALKTEIAKCRLLDSFCHVLHTTQQKKDKIIT